MHSRRTIAIHSSFCLVVLGRKMRYPAPTSKPFTQRASRQLGARFTLAATGSQVTIEEDRRHCVSDQVVTLTGRAAVHARASQLHSAMPSRYARPLPRPRHD